MLFYFVFANLVTWTRHLVNMSCSIHYSTEDFTGMRCQSHYVDADHAVFRRCLGDTEGVATVPVCGLPATNTNPKTHT